MATKLKDANAAEIKSRKKAPPADAPQEPQENGASASPGIGDNSLTPEQEARALRISHVSKLRSIKRQVDRVKEDLDEVKGEFNDAMKLAKVDTGIDRKHFTELLADMSTSRKDLEASEKVRASLRTDWDLPVGFQGDLFADLPQETRDMEWAKGVGYAMGLRGDPLEPPEGMEPRFDSSLMAGYSKGQEELIWANAAAGRITERKKGATTTGPTREEIERQPEPEDEPDPADEAARLIGAGWADPGDDPRETLAPSEFESGDIL